MLTRFAGMLKKLLRVFNTTAVGGPKNSGKQILKKKKKKQQQKSLDNYSFLIWTVLCPT